MDRSMTTDASIDEGETLSYEVRVAAVIEYVLEVLAIRNADPIGVVDETLKKAERSGECTVLCYQNPKTGMEHQTVIEVRQNDREFINELFNRLSDLTGSQMPGSPLVGLVPRSFTVHTEKPDSLTATFTIGS